MQIFIKDEPANRSTGQISCNRRANVWVSLPKVGWEHIFTYVKAVESLLKLFVIDANIANVTYNIVFMKKIQVENWAQVPNVVRTKHDMCGNACCKEKNIRILIEGLTVDVQSAIRIF